MRGSRVKFFNKNFILVFFMCLCFVCTFLLLGGKSVSAEETECEHSFSYQEYDWESHTATCDLCGYTETLKHIFSYVNNGYDYSVYADTHTATCDLCEYSVTHTHGEYYYSFNDFDEEQHVIKCDDYYGCGFEVKANHTWYDFGTYDSISDFDGHDLYCSGCLAKHKFDHVFTDVPGQPCDTTCDECGYYVNRHEMTDLVITEEGHKYSCSTCGYSLTDFEAHKMELAYDEEQHYFRCADCGGCETEKYDHIFSVECDRTCNDCSYERNVDHLITIFIEHSDDEVDYGDHYAVCEYCRVSLYREDCKGYIDYGDYHTHCLCGEKEEHRYSNGCDTTCNDCGHVRKDITHTYYNGSVVTSDGSKHISTCYYCGEEAIQEHNYSWRFDGFSWNTPKHVYECSDCGWIAFYTDEHVYSSNCDATCNVHNCDEGNRDVDTDHTFTIHEHNEYRHWSKCLYCQEVDEYLDHNFVLDSSQSNDEKHIYNCECGYTKEESHKYEWYYENGEHIRKCRVCEHVKEITTDHVYRSACDTTCELSECGYVRTNEYPHRYDNGAAGYKYYDDQYHYQICNMCDYVNEETKLPHDELVEKVNGDHSWKECPTCKYTTDVISHTWIVYECSKMCSECGYYSTNYYSSHTYDSVCDEDCNVCGYKRDDAHSYDSVCDEDCNECGYKRDDAHYFYDWRGDEWRGNIDGHWKQCYYCEYKTTLESHEKNYEFKDESQHYIIVKCDICGVNYSTEEDHQLEGEGCEKQCSCGYIQIIHTYENENDSSNGEYYCDQTCTECGEKSGEHYYIRWEYVDDTHHKQVCSNCGFEPESGALVEHNYQLVYDDNSWYHYLKCLDCGDKLISSRVSHSYDNDCDNECDICGYKRREVPHVYTDNCDSYCNNGCGLTRVAPHNLSTRADDEYHWSYCEDCRMEFDDKAKHNLVYYVDYDDRHYKDCIECGYRELEYCDYDINIVDDVYHTISCIYCGDENSGIHSIIDTCEYEYCESCTYKKYHSEPHHNYQWYYNNYDDDGNHYLECSNMECCNRVINIGPHQYDNDCDWYCNDCGYERMNAKSHMEEYSLKYDSEGHWKVCDYCGEGEKDEFGNLIKNSHSPNEKYHNEEGKHWYICYCGYESEKTDHTWEITYQCNRKCSFCYDVYEYIECDFSKYESNEYQHWIVCANCGYNPENYEGHTHDYQKDETYHWYGCICGYDSTKEEHIYSNNCDNVCNNTDCLYERVAPHYYEFKYNDLQHWQVCSNCGEINSESYINHEYETSCNDSLSHSLECACGYSKNENHEFKFESIDGDTHTSICSACNYQENKPHSYSDSYEYDSESHYKKCLDCEYILYSHEHVFQDDCTDTDCDDENCNYVRSAFPHVFDDACDVDCNICGELREAPHQYALVYTYEYHWNECELCGQSKNDEYYHCDEFNYFASVDEYGNSICAYGCSTCGYVDWYYNDHYYPYDCSTKCGNCGYENPDPSEHYYSYSCSTKCDYCGEERIAPNDHYYSYSWNFDYDNPNQHYGYCDYCSEIKYEEHEISSYSGYDDGHYGFCEKCYSSIGDVMPHNYGNDCDDYCSDCGYWRDAPHNYEYICSQYCDDCGSWRDAWCSYDYNNLISNDDCSYYECEYCGSKEYQCHHDYDAVCSKYCNWCGYARENIGEHNWSYYEWYSDEGHCLVCSDCYAYDVDNIIPHSMETIQESLNHYDSCKVCGYSKNHGNHDYLIEPKYAHDETHHWLYCETCDYDSIYVYEHVFDNNCDTTCNQEGCGYEREFLGHVFDNDCDGECNSCGQTRQIDHSYGAEKLFDSNNHWLECSVCGNKKDIAAHDFTENTLKCSGCDYEEAAQAPQEPNHIYDNDCDTTCNICGISREIEHKYNVQAFDERNHWLECSVCGEKDPNSTSTHIYELREQRERSSQTNKCDCGHTVSLEESSKQATLEIHTWTLEADGSNHWYRCNTCKMVRDIEAHKCVSEHDYKHNETHHWLECSDCGFEAELKYEHIFDNDCDTTCNQEGCTYTRIAAHKFDNDCDTDCNDGCGYVREAIHDYSVTSHDEEKHWNECSVCGDIDDESIEAHQLDENENCNFCEYHKTNWFLAIFDWLKYVLAALVLLAFGIWMYMLHDRSGV